MSAVPDVVCINEEKKLISIQCQQCSVFTTGVYSDEGHIYVLHKTIFTVTLQFDKLPTKANAKINEYKNIYTFTEK